MTAWTYNAQPFFSSEPELNTYLTGGRAGYPLAILSTQRKLKFGWQKRWAMETRIYSSKRKAWIVILKPCDEIPLKPIDERPRLPQSIHYPSGMKPKATGGVISNRPWEVYVGPTSPKNPRDMDVWVRG